MGPIPADPENYHWPLLWENDNRQNLQGRRFLSP